MQCTEILDTRPMVMRDGYGVIYLELENSYVNLTERRRLTYRYNEIQEIGNRDCVKDLMPIR
jgi:hypothetical protein